MKLNKIENDIYHYLSIHKLSYLRKGFLKLLDFGIHGQNFKRIKYFIKAKDTIRLELLLQRLCEAKGIDFMIKKYVNKDYIDKTVSLRQNKYINKKLSEGQKRVLVWLDDKSYIKLSKIKNKLNMTNSQLFTKFISDYYIY